MQTTTRDQGGVTVVKFVGRLDTNTASEAQTTLPAILDKGSQKVLVDFTQLDYVSSAGLRVLLATAKRMGGSGGDLRLCGLNETVQEVFDMSGLQHPLERVQVAEDAPAQFQDEGIRVSQYPWKRQRSEFPRTSGIVVPGNGDKYGCIAV